MVEERIKKDLIKPLALTASILGLLEGLVWTVSSVLCICIYNEAIVIDVKQNSTNYFKLICFTFLNSNQNGNDNLLINPREFFIFMLFYLAFSVIWLVVSAFVMWSIIHNKWQLTKYLFGSWSAVTIFISLIDIILTALIAADYDYVKTKYENQLPLPVTYGIVMSLAARGYVLWIINVIFAAVMIKFLFDVIKNENSEVRFPIIHGYESTETNPPFINESVKDFWRSQETTPASNGYQNHGFERSQSFFPVEHPPEDRDEAYVEPYSSPPTRHEPDANDSNSFASRIAERFATIGKNKGRRSPPNHVAPPIIPEPDYTPPGSPKGLKSVLRSKSNYA